MSWRLQAAILGCFLLGGTLQAGPPTEKRNDFRQYTCIQAEEFEPADCRLSFMSKDDDLTTITDSGCFIEKDKKQFVRNYCPLQCGSADYAYILAQRPEASTSLCVLDESFGVVRRKHDWFLWRSLACAILEVQFDIGCIHSPSFERSNTTRAETRDELEGSGF